MVMVMVMVMVQAIKDQEAVVNSLAVGGAAQAKAQSLLTALRYVQLLPAGSTNTTAAYTLKYPVPPLPLHSTTCLLHVLREWPRIVDLLLSSGTLGYSVGPALATPYTTHHTPYTIHHTPYIHYTLYTIHHTPYTIHHDRLSE